MPLNTICYSSCDNCLPCLHLTGVIARKITLQVYNPLKNGLAGLISVDSSAISCQFQLQSSHGSAIIESLCRQFNLYSCIKST